MIDKKILNYKKDPEDVSVTKEMLKGTRELQ